MHLTHKLRTTWGRWKWTWKWRTIKIARHEIAGHEISRLQDMTRIDSILFNFSFFLVGLLWCWRCSNGTVKCDNEMNWKKDPMIHVTSLRVELSEQVTTPTLLMCNITNETIKICSSCKQFSTVQCIQISKHCYIYDEQAQLRFPR